MFFHEFVKYGSNALCPKHAKHPRNCEEAENYCKECEFIGAHGVIGSMDARCVVLKKFSHRLKQNHLARKSKKTCRARYLTLCHRRQNAHAMSGHPDRWNGMTTVLHDKSASELRNRTII